MIERVEKAPITQISSLRVGQMITQDYGKPTQRALTVVEKRDFAGVPVVWLASRDGDELMLTQSVLDAETYDLKTVPKRRSL